MGRKKNEVIELTAGMNLPQHQRVYVTKKTVLGFQVLELTTDNYISLDQKFEASRYYKSQDGGGFSGWLVRSVSDRNWITDPISTKQEALETMAEMVKINDAKKSSLR